MVASWCYCRFMGCKSLSPPSLKSSPIWLKYGDFVGHPVDLCCILLEVSISRWVYWGHKATGVVRINWYYRNCWTPTLTLKVLIRRDAVTDSCAANSEPEWLKLIPQLTFCYHRGTCVNSSCSCSLLTEMPPTVAFLWCSSSQAASYMQNVLHTLLVMSEYLNLCCFSWFPTSLEIHLRPMDSLSFFFFLSSVNPKVGNAWKSQISSFRNTQTSWHQQPCNIKSLKSPLFTILMLSLKLA